MYYTQKDPRVLPLLMEEEAAPDEEAAEDIEESDGEEEGNDEAEE